MAKQQMAFLFGAGASAEAGVCTSAKITEILVNYGSYCPSEGSTEIENILKYIQVRIGDYLGVRASDVNFEFIFGTLMELSNRQHLPVVPLLGEGDSLVKKLEQKIPLSKVVDKLYALLRELLFLTEPVDYFFPLRTFLDLSKPLDFFTLNYDMSLETALESLKIRYTTGYRQREKQPPVWDPSQFDNESFDARMFKLHGSINWGQFYAYPPPAEERPTFDAMQQAELYSANYPERVQFGPYPVGSIEPPGRTAGMVSIMNFGTRKEELYASTQFTVLFNYFLTSLRTSKILVIAGYSFQDQAINRIIEEAVFEGSGDLRLVIVNPSMYWIEQRYPLLRNIIELQRATCIETPLSEALSAGSLREAVNASTVAKPATVKRDIGAPEKPSPSKPEPVDPGRVLQAWEQLGIIFDLTYSWWKRLAPELRELEKSITEQNAIEIGRTLMPVIGKVRDLCHHIRWVYEEMHFDGTYGGKYLSTIIVLPKQSGKFDRDLLSKWLPELGMSINLVFNTYNSATEEFRRAVNDPNYGLDGGAPSNFSVAEIVIRKTKSRIYELAWLLNDIYKGAGFEEPFELIAKNESGQSQE